ncbi:MAG TPA: hypothetical protein VII12_04150 [Thermoanaerobaculia bacterium]
MSRRFAVRGERVFAVDGRGVAAYDVSQSTVRRLAFAETGGEALDFAFLSDRDLAVATRAGIDRFSVESDGTLIALANYPEAMVTVLASNGRYLAGGSATGIVVWQPDMGFVTRFPLMQTPSALGWHGDTLIAALQGVGVYFFDITGAREPSFISENARDVAVAGNTLYIAASVNGIAAYDLSGDGTPQLLSRREAGDRNFARLAVSASRLFAAELPNTVDVFDLTSGVPELTSHFNEPVQAIAASGSRLFVSGTIFDQFGLPTETGAPLRIFDSSDPAASRLAGEFRDLAGPVSGVVTDGTLAYVVDRPYFRVIDVSNTASPRQLASLLIDNIGDRVKVSGTLALLFGRGEVQIVDINNPYAPRLVNVYHAQGGPPSNAAFARDTIVEANPYSGFHVVDITSFAEPGQIGGIKGHYYEVIASGGDVAYVSQEAVALVTIDLSDRHNPHPLNSVVIGPVRGELAEATAGHPQLLIMQTQSGIRIYSLADPRNPVETSFTPTSSINAIAADGDIAFLAVSGSVQRMDLSNPVHPSFFATTMQPLSPMQISTANGKVVIADRYSLRVYGPNTAPPPPPPPSRRRAARR